MGYAEDMARCLAYMEEHLDEKLPVSELADMLGYSLYHFCRVFKSIQGVSAGAYLRERRLEAAAKAILNGDSVTEAALAHGFDTPSGFNKAFRQQYGTSPTQFKQKGGITMIKVEIKKMDAFSAIGYCLEAPEGKLDPAKHGAYWQGKDFSSVTREDYAKLTYPGYAEIGIWMHPDDVSGDCYYFLGPTVKSKDFVPEGMAVLDIPAAEYAVFTVPAGKDSQELGENVRKTWKYIFAEWFDKSEWKYDERKMDFEYYQGEGSYIYVPVIKK